MEGDQNTNQNQNPAPQPQGGQQAPSSVDNTTLMGILAYLGPLVIIPFLTSKNDPVVKFHIKQGLVLVVIELIVYVAGMMVWMLAPVFMIVNIGTLVLSILGILNVVNKKQAELPLVGQFGNKFTF